MFEAYWRFAAERQAIFHRRARGDAPPWTDDPVISVHKFTNAYRAADRVSQFLIKNVLYAGEQSAAEVFFRTLLFKLFNRIETWRLIEAVVGAPSIDEYDVARYDSILTKARARGERIYSAAYIMPPASPDCSRKHLTHLRLIRSMLDDSVPERLAEADSMRTAYDILLGHQGIGPFLAYQLITDLNYSSVLNFSEMEFVVAGPGARSGIRKCFSNLGSYSDEDVIRYATESQEEEFERLGINFEDLFGRPLQLIDCQNLFCEIDKYARVQFPTYSGIGNRSRIKQLFRPDTTHLPLWFPPKWGLNHRVPRSASTLSAAAAGQG